MVTIEHRGSMIGVFLDTETNGLNPRKHSIFEIAYKMIDLRDGKEIFSFHTVVKHPKEVFDCSDPSSLEINGFTFDEIQKGIEVSEVNRLIVQSFEKHNIVRKKAVFICQNPSFDRAFFSSIIPIIEQEKMQLPYHWLDLASMYWAISIFLKQEDKFPWKTGISKDQIASSMNLEEEPIPHRAQNGTNHLVQCYEKLVGYPQA